MFCKRYHRHGYAVVIICCLLWPSGCVHRVEIPDLALQVPDEEVHTAHQANRFEAAAKGALSPVYPGLARQIVSEFHLADKAGLGIDLGGGPGTLVVELIKRTRRMYWINADINPHNFTHFYRNVEAEGLGHRAGAVFADAHALPFRDNYADIVVSRGTFQFWNDKRQAFSEVLRVLKPGGTAFIGRGLPDAMLPEQARAIRQKHGHGPKYDLVETEAELHIVMKKIGVDDYRIRIHRHPDAPNINYGIWLEFRKALPTRVSKRFVLSFPTHPTGDIFPNWVSTRLDWFRLRTAGCAMSISIMQTAGDLWAASSIPSTEWSSLLSAQRRNMIAQRDITA